MDNSLHILTHPDPIPSSAITSFPTTRHCLPSRAPVLQSNVRYTAEKLQPEASAPSLWVVCCCFFFPRETTAVLLALRIPLQSPAVKMTSFNLVHIHGNAAVGQSLVLSHWKSSVCQRSKEPSPWLQPTGFLRNIPFTWKFLPSEDCWR